MLKKDIYTMNFFLCNFLDIFILVRNQEQCQRAKLMLWLLKYKVFTSGYQQGLTLEYFFRTKQKFQELRDGDWST